MQWRSTFLATLLKFEPHTGELSLPLEVGKTWIATYVAYHSSGEIAAATTKWEVVGFDDVTTPAGAFMAYRIVQTAPSDASFEFFFMIPTLRWS